MKPGTLLRWYALKNTLKSEIKNNSIVLDIGGYDGFIAYNLKRLFANLKITVVDIDKSGLRIAKERGLTTLYASALELPIEDNSIDVVICLDLIEHVKEDDKLIKEIARVLKIGGKIILSAPCSNFHLPFVDMRILNEQWGHVKTGYKFRELDRLFKQNGLSIKYKTKYFNLLSRFMYWVAFLSNIPLRGKGLIYKTVIRLEPYFKYGAEEHIIIGEK